MCGRYTLTCPADEIAAEFGVDVPADYQPHYNIAPTQPVPIIGLDTEGEPKLALVRWGLVPFWAESPKDVKHTINARAESLLLKPAFREAFLNRRCLVIADGFYEWQRKDGRKQPFRFHLHGDKLFAFAGVWEPWRGEGGEPLYSCAIVTTAASPLVAPVHDRMPAILTPEQRDTWLNPTSDPVRLTELLGPYARPDLEIYPVSTRVNVVANDAPDLIEPADPVASGK